MNPDWPAHKPIAPEAPIPGRHWYGGCDPDRPRVGPAGICEGCGERACPRCGHGFYPDGGCGCPRTTLSDFEYHFRRLWPTRLEATGVWESPGGFLIDRRAATYASLRRLARVLRGERKRSEQIERSR